MPGGLAAAGLDSVSCVGTTCQAVGDNGADALVMSGGTSWSLETASATPPDSNLHAVSCLTASMCMAVGYQNALATSANLIERWNGTAWSTVSAPTAPLGASLDAVHCFGATSCVAGSSATLATSVSSDQILAWNGSSWANQTVPTPTTLDEAAALDCVPNDVCIAVGSSSFPPRTYPRRSNVRATTSSLPTAGCSRSAPRSAGRWAAST